MRYLMPLTLAALAFSAQGAEWEDLKVNSINRLPARSYTMPLARETDALTTALDPATPYRKSLNGMWKISWAGNPDLRIADFYREGFDDSTWFEIDVPSCVEMRGFGTPSYTNVRYPHAWDPKRDLTAPTIRDRDTDQRDYNPVSSYRTRFTVPSTWSGRDVILRFDGVYSAYYVWVNGQKVGYAEDSKLPSEFDITRFLKSGENVLAVEVYRWSDGSFLEDQDMFRFSGIFRDVTLWAKPKDGIWDFAVKTTLRNDYRDATLAVEGLEGVWSATLYDANRRAVARLSNVTQGADISNVNLWSAEKPYLYTLVIRKGEDIRMRRIGFKEQKIVRNAVFVNGKPIKFKGVNRHESNPENGRTVSLDDMLKDITLFKKYNINTVRTCHYPDHHLWYDLCDRYGIYVVAEANVEGHEPDYRENALGIHAEWDHSIVERNERNVLFHRNNPSVTFWSMGNETGHGDCFRHAIAAVRKIDPSRLVHWERGNVDVDVDSRMYPPVEWLEGRGKQGDMLVSLADGAKTDKANGAPDRQSNGKAFFMCEYAHAMGNAIGNFREYWDVFYRYDCLSGGCIWDWVDQAVWRETDKVDPKTGRRERYLAYGGDFDEEPNDGPFCCNGVVDPFRNVTAKLVEVGHVHRNLVVTKKDDGFELWNRFGFTTANEFAGRWELLEDGVCVASGTLDVPAIAPLARGRFTVPAIAAHARRAGREYLVNFSFELRADTLWAKKGWAVARNQVALDEAFAKPLAALPKAKPVIVEGDRTVTVTAGGTRAVFCRKSGTLCELVMDGKTILRDAAPGVVAGPRFGCQRAFTDNDRWLRDGNAWHENRKEGSFYSRGLTQLSYHARPIAVTETGVRTCVEVTGSKSGGFTHETTWTFAPDGSVDLANVVTPHGTMPKALARIGTSWKLDPSLESMVYYGRGPRENYIDRNSGSFIGLWKSSVTEQYEPYVRPQDNGYKSGVRWVTFTDAQGRGVRFAASEPLFVQALHYDMEDMELARHRAGMKRYRGSLEPVPEVRLNLDVRQLGLGGASCGPEPMQKYVFPIEKTSWTLRLEPICE